MVCSTGFQTSDLDYQQKSICKWQAQLDLSYPMYKAHTHISQSIQPNLFLIGKSINSTESDQQNYSFSCGPKQGFILPQPLVLLATA